MTIRIFCAAAFTAAAFACCFQPLAAQQPGEDESSAFSAEQDRDPGPPPRREARSPRDRGPDGDRRPEADRGPEARGPDGRRPDDRPPQPRGREGGGFGGGGFGGGGFGGGGARGGFGPGGPQFGPPPAPMAGPHHDNGLPAPLDERITRLEHKLDAILHELHALRSEHQHFGSMPQRAQGGYGAYGMASRMAGPPHWAEGPQPGRFGPPGGPPRGPRAGGPPREWDSPPPPRGDRARGRDRDDDDDDDRPRGGDRDRRNE